MRHRLFLLLLCLSFLFGITALAEDTGRLTLMPVTETVRPGKGITLSYYAPAAGVASLQLVDAYEPLVREADPEVRRYVKAADKLAAWLKCQEELKAGNAEFRRAADETLTTLRAMGMEEVDWFLDRLGGAFQLTLDDLG